VYSLPSTHPKGTEKCAKICVETEKDGLFKPALEICSFIRCDHFQTKQKEREITQLLRCEMWEAAAAAAAAVTTTLS